VLGGLQLHSVFTGLWWEKSGHGGGTLDVLQIMREWHIAPERLRAE
jgi:hypothetical protein